MLYLLFYVTLACKHFDFLFAIIYMYKILFISIIIACSKLSVYLFGLLILILLLFCIKTTFKLRFSYTSQLKLKSEIFIPLNWYVYYFMLFLLFLLYIIFVIDYDCFFFCLKITTFFNMAENVVNVVNKCPYWFSFYKFNSFSFPLIYEMRDRLFWEH